MSGPDGPRTGLQSRRADRTKVTDPSKRNAPKQEKRLALQLGGETVRGSGSGVVKGDVRIKGVARIEAKGTRRKSFSVTRELIDKIEDASATNPEGEIPVVHIQFLDPDGTPEKGLYIMREADVHELLGERTDAVTTQGNVSAREGSIQKRRS